MEKLPPRSRWNSQSPEKAITPLCLMRHRATSAVSGGATSAVSGGATSSSAGAREQPEMKAAAKESKKNLLTFKTIPFLWLTQNKNPWKQPTDGKQKPSDSSFGLTKPGTLGTWQGVRLPWVSLIERYRGFGISLKWCPTPSSSLMADLPVM